MDFLERALPLGSATTSLVRFLDGNAQDGVGETREDQPEGKGYALRGFGLMRGGVCVGRVVMFTTSSLDYVAGLDEQDHPFRVVSTALRRSSIARPLTLVRLYRLEVDAGSRGAGRARHLLQTILSQHASSRSLLVALAHPIDRSLSPGAAEYDDAVRSLKAFYKRLGFASCEGTPVMFRVWAGSGDRLTPFIGWNEDHSGFRRLRQETPNWSTEDCERLVERFGTPEAALREFNRVQAAVPSARRIVREIRRDESQDWWMAMFFDREPSALTLSHDHVVKKWGDLRSELDEYVTVRTTDLTTFDRASQVVVNPDRWRDRVTDATWKLAWRSHRLPTFEPTWLPTLQADPFAELRPLKQETLAQRMLERHGRFELGAGLTQHARYVAEAIRQAEQLWLGAKAVDLTTSPLLAYYMATNLGRALLPGRLKGFQPGRHKSHGCQFHRSSATGGLDTMEVEMTSTIGLTHLLRDALPGAPPLPPDDRWQLLDLLALIPELAQLMDEHAPRKSNCHALLKWADHMDYRSLEGMYPLGPILPRSYLARVAGIDPAFDLRVRLSKEVRKDAVSKIRKALPSCFWRHCRLEEVQGGLSSLMDDHVIAAQQFANDDWSRRRLIPLLYTGGLDGRWHVIWNRGAAAPNQTLVLLLVLYAFSMLVRYHAVDWRATLLSDDHSAALIDRFVQIALVKLPIIATELLLGRSILGSVEPPK
jgi:hypothetical protein